jgi:hypothetical protein
MFKNKKGLASGILAIIIVMFIFALCSLIALKGWNEFNDSIQSISDDIIEPDIKQNIDNLSYIFDWGDKVFVMLFIALLISYLISSVTLPAEKPIFFLIFIGVLIITCILAMGISNMWDVLGNIDILQEEAATMTFTNWFMGLLPFITLFVGIAGGIIFYSKPKTDDAGGSIEGF